MIYGLVAALGWGLADFFAALAGRRLGSLMAVLIGQALAAVSITVLFLASGAGLSSLTGWWWLVAINGVLAMSAYALHYHALELGPVSVVSPIGAGYAVVGVLLAIAGFGYAFDSVGAVLSESAPVISSVTFLGEFLLGIWLLVRSRRVSLAATLTVEPTKTGVRA